MASLLTSARRMFAYGNLEGDNRSSGGSYPSMEMTESGGIVSGVSGLRKRRKCLWASSVLAGLVALVIIVATIKTRHHIQSVAEALVREDRQTSDRDQSSSEGDDNRRKITFQDYLYYKFYPESYNGTWYSDHEIKYLGPDGSLNLYDLEKKKKHTILRASDFLRLNPIEETFSADRKYILVKQESQKVWRRSSIGSYVLVKVVNGIPQTNKRDLIPLRPKSATNEALGIDLNQYLRYVSWSPSGNAIAYVDYNNNLHYRHTAEAEDEQLTTSGEDGVIYNGIPDWVSEEEVFEENHALWWSPDGSRLVYGVFNDSLVESVALPRYGSWHKAKTDRQGYPWLQYSLLDSIKYPKAGSINPSVKLMAASVGVAPGQRIRQVELPPPNMFSGQASHFSNVAWRDNNTAAVIWMNRVQNVSSITMCSILEQTSCRDAFNLSIRDGWVDYKFGVKFNKYVPGPRFLAILPAGDMKYRYRQLYVVDTDGDSRTKLTNSQSEVTEILEWTKDDTVYYIATLPGDPGSRHLHKLRIGQQGGACLTCGTGCGFVASTFSPQGSYFSADCKGPDIPLSTVHKVADDQAIIQWTDNQKLRQKVSQVQMPRIEFLQVPVPGSDQKAQVQLFIPPNRRNNSERMPMLVDVYGGPGFQKVDKSWKGYEYAMYMAGALGIVYAVIDPRGSGFQGDKWRHAVYRKFGSAEVADTITVTKYLQDNLDYVDQKRTAIWGWSYGGYLSLSALTRDTGGVFSCGASVAPVVRWELYDTVYTERYMGRPEDNEAGYNASTPLWRLENIRSKKYYLIHGTHDDNVHYQQSMMLSAALEEKDILFRQQSYPDQDHSIQDYKKHLYHSLTSFFSNDCFNMNLSR